ncbi:hypothetical protein [Sphingobacterium sp. NPDC055431]
MSTAINYSHVDLADGNELYIIDIEDINNELEKILDSLFVKICEGSSGSPLAVVKQKLINNLSTKRGSDIEMGAIAEFFIHIFLNEIGCQPQFLYLNLEENSIKKGFDGYYLIGSEQWIMESKSGHIDTKNLSHKGKIKEAYNDLKSKLQGDKSVKNSPWDNAYQHASQIDVGADRTVRQEIKILADLFVTNRDFFATKPLTDYNIIPASTIFLKGTWVHQDKAIIESDIRTIISKFHFKNIKVVCLTKKSLAIFWDYLNTTT